MVDVASHINAIASNKMTSQSKEDSISRPLFAKSAPELRVLGADKSVQLPRRFNPRAIPGARYNRPAR